MKRTDAEIVRYSTKERVVHTAAVLAFLYVLLTGLAFWTPGLYWIAVVLGGGFLSRLLHPWAGLLLFAIVLWMLAMWHADMRTTDADRRWREALLAYVRNEDADVPAAGRFNYGQKVFFWMMLWGASLLAISGLVLWFPEAVPRDARVVRQIAALVHAVAALVVIGAFIIHVYMGVWVVPGSVDAILHGTVTRDWARQHHRRWANEAASPPRTIESRADVSH